MCDDQPERQLAAKPLLAVTSPDRKLPNLASVPAIPPRRLLLMAAFAVLMLLDWMFIPIALIFLIFAPFQRQIGSAVGMIIVGLAIAGGLFWLTRKTRRALSLTSRE